MRPCGGHAAVSKHGQPAKTRRASGRLNGKQMKNNQNKIRETMGKQVSSEPIPMQPHDGSRWAAHNNRAWRVFVTGEGRTDQPVRLGVWKAGWICEDPD
jgi:hypothetical protein